MAKLPQQTGGSGLQIKELAPAGQHIATCLRIVDLFGVERPSFENPQVKEIKDVTRFIFGLVGADGKEYIVQTYEFSISAAPGANLMKFLKTWLGRDAQVGWDYAEMKGTGAMLTIQHKASTKNTAQSYANISGIAPVFPALAGHIQPASRFEAKLAALERESMTPPAGGNTPPPPGPSHGYPPPPPPQHHNAATRTDILPPPLTLSPDGKYQLVNNAWVPYTAPVTPPPPPPPVTPPPPPVTPPPPPPPAVLAKRMFAHINGQAVEVTAAQLTQMVGAGQGATPAIEEGSTVWSTVAQLGSRFAAPGSAPGFPPVRPTQQPLDEDVPF